MNIKGNNPLKKLFGKARHESDCRDQTYLEFISPSYTIHPHKG
jgi:hypothetical protein